MILSSFLLVGDDHLSHHHALETGHVSLLCCDLKVRVDDARTVSAHLC